MISWVILNKYILFTSDKNFQNKWKKFFSWTILSGSIAVTLASQWFQIKL